jgi:hypothetical protein
MIENIKELNKKTTLAFCNLINEKTKFAFYSLIKEIKSFGKNNNYSL